MASASQGDDKVVYKLKLKPTDQLEFDRIVYNPLFDAIKLKYDPPIAEGHQLLVGLKKIEKYKTSYKLIGKFATKQNGKNVISDSVASADTQPLVWILCILSNITTIQEEHDLSNELFEHLTTKLRVKDIDYLEFDVGDRVLMKPRPVRYDNGYLPVFLDPVPAVITAKVPHTVAGDISYEYECNVDNNAQNVHGGAVHSCELRPASWEQTIDDTFDTSIQGLLEFEAHRAIDAKMHGYLSECGLLIKDYPYLDIDSAYYGRKFDYYKSKNISNETIKVFLSFLNSNMMDIIKLFLQTMKPNGNNMIKVFNNSKTDGLRRHGITVEAVIMDAVMNILAKTTNDNENINENSNNNRNNSDEKTNEPNFCINKTQSHIKVDFYGFDSLALLTTVPSNSIKVETNRGTTIELVCNLDHKFQWIWNRNSKLWSIRVCSYKTLI